METKISPLVNYGHHPQTPFAKKEVMVSVVKYDLEKPSDKTVGDPSQIPNPTGYRMLIAPMRAEEKTEGGIYLTEERQAKETSASVVACVLKMGDDCYADKKKFPTGAWCKIGDWVLVPTYAGTRIEVHDMEFRIINDDTIHAVVDDPRGIARQ